MPVSELKVVSNATCTFCGCVCDDMELTVEDHKITKAKNACVLARTAGWKISVSARSGETEDDWLADLAVGWSGDFIKVGSITQSERLSKYNRLLTIEHEFESRFRHRQS